MKRSWFLLATLAFASPQLFAGQPEVTAGSQVRAEIARLRAAVQQKPASGKWKDAKASVGDLLDESAAALRAGRMYLSLEDLRRARNFFRATELSDIPESKKDLSGFESTWSTASVKLTAFDQSERGKPWSGFPAAIRALGEASEGRVMPLVEASRAYAKVTSAAEGFYYLGEAQAESDWVQFTRSLKITTPAAPLVAHSISPQIEKLQEDTNAIFQPPLSIERHRDFIMLNAAIKMARELDAAQLYAGALYRYLDALQQFATLDAATPTAAQKLKLQRDLSSLKSRMSAERDDSIAQLFVQRTEALLSKGAAASDHDWKNVAAIIQQVLPAYFAALGAPPAERQVAQNAVTVTLVRWPYT